MLYIIHHWLLPLISAGVWFGTLWAMMIVWLAKGQPRYRWQDGQIAFISDVGASGLKPLFIAGASVTGVFFVLSVAADRLLRHVSRLPRNMQKTERILSYFAILGSMIGGGGLILLSIFDTNHHPTAHRGFLLMFIVGVAISAIFTTCEYRLLDKHQDHQNRLLKASYIFKIVIVTIEIGLAIGFGVSLYAHQHEVAGVLEWLVSFLLTFYLLSFAVDLWPAAKAQKGAFANAKHPGMVELGRGGSATEIAIGEGRHHQPEPQSTDHDGWPTSGPQVFQSSDATATDSAYGSYPPSTNERQEHEIGHGLVGVRHIDGEEHKEHIDHA